MARVRRSWQMGNKVQVTVHALLNLVDADGRSLVGDAAGRLPGKPLVQQRHDSLDRAACHVGRDDVWIADRLQSGLAAVLVGVQIVHHLVRGDLVPGGVGLEGGGVIAQATRILGDTTHGLDAAGAGQSLVPFFVHVPSFPPSPESTGHKTRLPAVGAILRKCFNALGTVVRLHPASPAY